MDVGRRKSGVVAGSVWESRMKVDQVRGGVKVFNGDQDNSEETSTNGVAAGTRARLKRAPAGGGGAASSGKRKTWKSETFEGLEKNPNQTSKGKTESVKNSDEQCKELTVSVDGIRKSPAQLRRLRSEGTKEIGVSAEKNERSPIGIRKPRRELLKSSSDLGEGTERNSIQLRKVKSESSRGIDDASGSAIQSEKAESEPNKASDESDKEMAKSEPNKASDASDKEVAKSEPNKASDESDKEIESVDVSVKEIEESPVENSEIGDDGSDENCKEFVVCEEMVVKSSGGSNAAVLKSDDDRNANEGNDGDDGGDESEEDVDEEIEVEIEKKSVDIKEVNAAPEEKSTTKIVKEEKVVKVNEVKKPAGLVRTGTGPALLQLERREVKKLLQKPPESISLNLKKSPPPVIKRASVYPKVPKYNYSSFSASNERHSSFPETHSRLQSLVDLIMWKDISRSVFVFGIGTFVILSSSYTKDINISFISVISYLGLLYLAAIFLFKSIIRRGVLEVDNTNYVVGEQEAIWLLKLVLPYLNEFLLKLKALFSGDPATTIKLAVLLFVLGADHLVSPQGYFKLGFFSPGASSNLGATSNRFLGIWYSKLPNHPDAVWVANPETPVADSSGVFMLDSDGKMKIKHGGGEIILWDHNQTVSGNVTGYMMDTGNFMLREVESDGTPGKILWESLDYPSNTLLPGMKLGLDFRTGRNRTLSSWFSGQVPTPGAFRLGVDPNRTNRLIIWRRDVVYWTSGIWESGSFQMAPELTSRVDLFDFSFVSNAEEKYFTYSVKDNSTLSRWELNTRGQLLRSILASDGTTWETTPTGPCTFNPEYPDAVCIKQTTSECRNGSELFLPIRGYLIDAQLTYNDSNPNSDLSDCHAICWRDCACIGYGPLHPNGSGCMYMREGAHFVKNNYFGVNYLVTIANNSRDGTPTEGSKNSKWWIWCIVGIILAVAVLLLGYFLYTRKRKPQHVQQTDNAETIQEQGLLDLGSQISGMGDMFKLKFGKSRRQEFKMFSFPELVAATDDFSFARRLGEGGFGPVYKGVLPDGKQVAVKRLARHSGQGLEEFMNEITLIAELQHSNLVQLLGCCIQGEEKILIYEYLTNTSLDAFLFDSTRVYLLDWQRRINIIEGIAQGLLYLHKYSRVRVIHRDLKASNILLDESMKPKISDFGMARIFGQNESRANTNRVVGTYGYMSPEYAMNGIFSEKSDVYSFGVLLLEIVSGRKNTVFVSSTNLNLIELAWGLWQQGDCLEMRDPSMDSCPKDEVSTYVHVGLLCVQEHAADRPTMSDVISMLTSDVMSLPDPKQPAFYVSRSESGSSQAEIRSDMGSSNCVSITVMEPR